MTTLYLIYNISKHENSVVKSAKITFSKGRMKQSYRTRVSIVSLFLFLPYNKCDYSCDSTVTQTLVICSLIRGLTDYTAEQSSDDWRTWSHVDEWEAIMWTEQFGSCDSFLSSAFRPKGDSLTETLSPQRLRCIVLCLWSVFHLFLP